MNNENENVKRELTLDELEEQMKTAREQYETLAKTVANKKQEAKERKEAELALVKEVRKKEIEEKEKELRKLYNSFLKDYGSINLRSDSDDFFSPFWKNHFFF